MAIESVAASDRGKVRALVLIPARDEEATIGQVVSGCLQAGFAVLVVDDGSVDRTAARARAAGADLLSVSGPQHGKTAALGHGLAQLPPSVEWLFFLDADGQHRPSDLEGFWQRREGMDMIVGNRFRDAARMPVLRRWTNRLMSALLRGGGVIDSQCGFRLVRRSWLGAWRPAGHHFQFETELALHAARHPSRIANLPIPAIYEREQSKISPARDAFNFLRCLFRPRRDLTG